MWWRRPRSPFAAARRLDRVQRLAHRAVADRVEMHLESVGVELRNRLLEQLRLDHRDAAHVFLAFQLVRLEHDGGVILHHAVLHDLDGARVDASRGELAAQLLDRLDLLEPLVALPPDGADHAQREFAGFVEAAIGLEFLFVHRCVLHARDAETVEHLDRVAQAGIAFRVGVGGRLVGDEAARALLQAARRLAGLRVAVDAPVRGILRVLRDARDFERLAVDPGRVSVPAPQDDRAIGDDGVDQFLARERARAEGGHRPAATLDPGVLGMLVGVLLDDGDVLVDRGRRIQVAAVCLDATRDRMDVHVLHARQDHPAFQVDDLGLRTDVVLRAGVVADVHDAPVVDRDGLGPAAGAVHGVDCAIAEGEVRDGGFLRVHRFGRLASAARDRGGGQEHSNRPRKAGIRVLHHW